MAALASPAVRSSIVGADRNNEVERLPKGVS